MVTICTSVPIWSRTWGAIGLVLSWLCHKFDFETCVNHDSFVMKAFFLLTINYFYPFLSLSSKLLSVKLLRHIGWLRVKMTKKLRRKISARFAKRQAKRAVKRVPTNPFSNVFWRKGGVVCVSFWGKVMGRLLLFGFFWNKVATKHTLRISYLQKFY